MAELAINLRDRVVGPRMIGEILDGLALQIPTADEKSDDCVGWIGYTRWPSGR